MSEQRKREHVIGVRVDEPTYDRWLWAARARGMSVPELVRG